MVPPDIEDRIRDLAHERREPMSQVGAELLSKSLGMKITWGHKGDKIAQPA